MSKIIGITVGTPQNPKKIGEILTINDLGFGLDDTLKFDEKTKILSVNTADKVEGDNTRPISSAAVHTEIGNIETLLSIL